MNATKLQSAFYRSTADTLSDVVIVADSAERIISCDPAAIMKVFGYRFEEVAGENLSLLLPEFAGRSRGVDRPQGWAAAEGMTAGLVYAISGRRKDGTSVPLDLSISETQESVGVRTFTWVMRDVTERVQLNTELRAIVERVGAAAEIEHQLLQQVRVSNQELKIANEGLQKFTSIVAHDLSSPLRRIEAFVGVLQQDFRPALNEEGVDILDRIASGAARMRLMLDSLLQYSRYNSVAIAGKTAKLADVVRDALSAFDMEAVGMDVRVAVDDVPELKGDPVLLSHVLQNLIGNAVKFRTEHSATIDIQATQVGEEISVSVADNGIGIEPRFADKIFGMFYRLHDEEEYEGTGIGLAVCRKIVNDHGGRIWLDTTNEQGTKFIFTLRAASNMDLQPTKIPEKPRYVPVQSSGGRRSAIGADGFPGERSFMPAHPMDAPVS